MCKKFIFVFFVFILIFSFSYNSFASGGVAGLTYNVPESPDYPNHTYIFIFNWETGNESTSGVFMLKYYMPFVVKEMSSSVLRISYVNGLRYKYNPDTDEFEMFGAPHLHNNHITGIYKNSDGEFVNWDDPTAVTGIFPLASNHNIYLDDDTLFFWTPQQSISCPHLYRLPVTEMMKTLLVVGGRTLGIVLAAFGIVLGVSLVKRLIFWFLH